LKEIGKIEKNKKILTKWKKKTVSVGLKNGEGIRKFYLKMSRE